MRVSDLMTRDVVVVEADDTVQRAGELMEAHDVGVLPVYDEGKLVGMVSDRDIAIRLAAAGFAAWSVRVREVMTPGVVTVPPEMDEADALELMQHKGVRRLVVVWGPRASSAGCSRSTTCASTPRRSLRTRRRTGEVRRRAVRLRATMSEAPPPYWLLLSVLFSSQPLSESLAMCLHQAAYDLYRKDGGVGEVIGDLARGKVRNLKKDVLLGTIGGPAFEAEIETERGAGVVRFLLTRQGLAMMQAREQRRELLN